jgi:purine-nucleoside phosphorylase
MNTAKVRNVSLKYGKTITSDVFDLYCDDEDKFRGNFPDMNFLAVEMEAFGLFYIAKKLGREASCLMTVVDSLYDKRSLSSEERETSLNTMITLALDAITK